MSKQFLGKMAAGVAFGTAALLVSAPGMALADHGDPKHDPKHDRKHEKKVSGPAIEQSDRSAFNTAQNNQSKNKVTAKADRTAVAVNVPIQINSIDLFGGLFPLNTACLSDLDAATLESANDIETLGDAIELLQWVEAECSGLSDGKTDGKKKLGYHKVVPSGEVAAGDGGALAAGDLAGTNTAGLAAAGAGLLGVAALGGTALLRRRSADDPVA